MLRASRPARTTILAAPLLLLLACVTESKGPSRDSFMGRMRDRPSETAASSGSGTAARTRQPEARERPAPATSGESERPSPRPPPAPRPRDFPDTRVMFYQPKGDLLMILVNEAHSGRATESGRVALALGESNRAYKILSDAQMDALLKSLANAGYDVNADEFVLGDEQYLAKTAGEIPRYQGIISVEQGPSKTKLLGFRRASEGDALGLKRYQAYTVLKSLVQKWFGDSSQSEFPVGGVSIGPGK
jgi:hypothetical protein